jgi:hypothetical protein
MAKAKRVHSTPRRTAPSSRKPSSKSTTLRSGQVDAPAKVLTTNADGPSAVAVAEKSNHYGNPEEQICDLMRAADLCAYLTDDWLTEGRIQQGSLYIYLPDDFAERLIFVADEVRTRVSALKEFYYNDGFARSRAKPAE